MKSLFGPFAILMGVSFLPIGAVSAGTLVASSCSTTAVQAAVNSAAEGDSVEIPNGSCSWTARVLIAGKGIHVKAQSSQGVTLTHNAGGGTLFEIDRDGSHSTRISGIRFMNGSGTGTFIDISGRGKPWLVDDCYFQSTGQLFQTLRATANGGVFWDNVVEAPAGKYHLNGNIQINAGAYGTTEWQLPPTLGSADTTGESNTYIESNTFTGILQVTIDASNGGRIVFRHNTMRDAATVVHGADTDQFGGVRHFEFYDNTFTRVSDSYPINRWFYIRGGTGVIADNVFPDASSSSYPNKQEIDLTIQNLRRSDGPYACWSGGYPAPHQVGQVTDSRDSTPSWPLAIWNNTKPGGAAWVAGEGNYISISDYPSSECGAGAPSASTFIVRDRDYITRQPAGYTKYTYPHPLARGDDATKPLPPAGVTIGTP